MCGRFTLYASPEQLAAAFDLPEAPILAPRFNIAPTQPVGIVRMAAQAGQREWALTIWGLIPSWSKDPSMGARLINARSESVPEKPSFRAAFKRRRCLVPASGFYEWKQVAKGKEPYYFSPAASLPGGADVFGFAGLWETWTGPDGGQLQSCTILTVDANATMSSIHNRMPLILAPEDWGTWLGSGRDESPQTLAALQHLFRPYANDGIKLHRVSTYVNNARNEGEQCIEPV
jgi:putative SOS response-associated peptidase YedK